MTENNTWQYFVGVIVIGLLVGANYYAEKKDGEPFIGWVWFIIIFLIIIAGYFIIENIIKKRNAVIPVTEKERVSTDTAMEFIDDWLYYSGDDINLDDCITSQIVEDRAFEETMKTDTPVIYINAISGKTKNKYDIIMRTEKNKIFEQLKKMMRDETKNMKYYDLLRDNLTITILQNFPYFGKDKQNAIRNFINAHATKSGLGIYQFDPQTKKYKKYEIMKEPDEDDEETEEEE